MVKIGNFVLFERLERAVDINQLFHTIEVDFLRVESLQEVIGTRPCPRCTQLKLRVLDYEIGGTGWESKIRCDNCHSEGIFNDTGFHIKLFNAGAVET